MKYPLSYVGGKSHLSRHIVGLLPKHRIYVEPFFGGGSVLFSKQPAAVEIANDLDDRVVNFFYVLREWPQELAEALQRTPFSRTEYNLAAEHSEDRLEVARRFFIRCRQSFGGHTADVWAITRSKNKAKDFASAADQLATLAERLRTVQIENCNALDLIGKCDQRDTTIYLDPPYLHETRTRHGHQYRHELTTDDHRELLKIVTNLKHARAVISGYDSDLYREYLDGENWRRFKFEVKIKLAQKADEAKPTRFETVWVKAA